MDMEKFFRIVLRVQLFPVRAGLCNIRMLAQRANLSRDLKKRRSLGSFSDYQSVASDFSAVSIFQLKRADMGFIFCVVVCVHGFSRPYILYTHRPI